MFGRVTYVAYACCLLELGMSVACGVLAPQNSQQDEAAISLSSNSIFQQLAAMTSAERASLAASAGKVTMLEYYADLLKGSSDAAVSIDSYTFSGALSQLKTEKAYYQSLAVTFPTLASYWRATGFDPTAAVSVSNLALAIRSAQQTAKPGLGLTDSNCPIAASANLNELSTLPAVGTQARSEQVTVSPSISDIPAGSSYYGVYNGSLQGSLYLAATPSNFAQDYRDKHTALIDAVANTQRSPFFYGATLPDGTQLSQGYAPSGSRTHYVTATPCVDGAVSVHFVDYDAAGKVTAAYSNVTSSAGETVINDPNGHGNL